MTMKVLTKEDIIADIKEAQKNWKLGEAIRQAKNTYKKSFGTDYDQDCHYNQIIIKENEYNE